MEIQRFEKGVYSEKSLLSGILLAIQNQSSGFLYIQNQEIKGFLMAYQLANSVIFEILFIYF